MENRFFTLPFTFSESALLRDLAVCHRFQWQQHFNRQDYSGRWTSIALRSASGQINDVMAHPGTQVFTDTPLSGECPYFREIMVQIACPKETVRLLSLAPGSVIREHTDPYTSYRHGFFRLHIPLQTANGVQFRVDGCDLPMRVGECWYADFELPHSVTNNGSADRIHLVMDCRRNAWSDALFEQAGYDFAVEKQVCAPSSETKRRMIAELARIDSEAARQLVAQLQGELDAEPAL